MATSVISLTTKSNSSSNNLPRAVVATEVVATEVEAVTNDGSTWRPNHDILRESTGMDTSLRLHYDKHQNITHL